MPRNLTTRMPNGVTNASPGQTLSQAGLPDPSWANIYHNDFNTFATGDWTITKTGTGTTALTAADGGALLLTNTTGATDAIYMQLVAAGFKPATGKEMFFKFQGTLSTITNCVFYCGFLATTTTPGSTQDAIYINKATATGALTLRSVVGGVTTTTDFPSTCALVAATQFELGIYVNEVGDVMAFFNPGTGNANQQVGPTTSGTATITARGPVAKLTAPGLTTAILNPSFGILNSNAAANTLTVDYLTAIRNR